MTACTRFAHSYRRAGRSSLRPPSGFQVDGFDVYARYRPNPQASGLGVSSIARNGAYSTLCVGAEMDRRRFPDASTIALCPFLPEHSVEYFYWVHSMVSSLEALAGVEHRDSGLDWVPSPRRPADHVPGTVIIGFRKEGERGGRKMSSRGCITTADVKVDARSPPGHLGPP